MLINNLNETPRHILESMRPLGELLLSENFTLDIIFHKEVSPVLDRLNEYLMPVRISSFHCTREPEAGCFASEGLRKLDVEFHQEWFIAKYGYCFDNTELNEIKEAFKICRGKQGKQKIQGREGKLWFCLMPEMVENGCENFFRYAGGEVIYKMIDNPKIKAKLEGIGRPVVVELCLRGRDVVSFQGLAIGLLNAYHRSVNPRAAFCPVEGYLKRNVTADEVVNVWEKDDFFAYHQLPI